MPNCNKTEISSSPAPRGYEKNLRKSKRPLCGAKLRQGWKPLGQR